MNEKNFAYLKDTLKYLGFGEKLEAPLRQKLEEGGKEFMLGHAAEFNERRIDATLFFRRSDTADMYFLNKWVGTVGQYEGARSQSFYINKGQGVTLKEGFNLLEGRAVHKELSDKEGQSYTAWLQLDGREKDGAGNYKVNQYHQKYGFDLQQKLEALPIKQLADPQFKEALIRSLQKGNVQAVTFEKNGNADELFITANPRFKTITAFDQGGRQIPKQTLESRYGLEQQKPELTIVGKAVHQAIPEKKQEPGKEVNSNTQKEQSEGMVKKRTGKRNGLHP